MDPVRRKVFDWRWSIVTIGRGYHHRGLSRYLCLSGDLPGVIFCAEHHTMKVLATEQRHAGQAVSDHQIAGGIRTPTSRPSATSIKAINSFLLRRYASNSDSEFGSSGAALSMSKVHGKTPEVVLLRTRPKHISARALGVIMLAA